MQNMFNNAVQSIQMGVEDYRSNKPSRALSAVRNFHAGLLLLAKEVLVRKVPNADEREIIAANHKPVPDGLGGVNYVARSKRTRLCLESGGNWFWRLSERVEFCGGQAARSRVSSAIS